MKQEAKVIKQIEKVVEGLGGLIYKIHIDQFGPAGLPDLIIVLPEIGTILVETKAQGKTPSSLQYYTIQQINSHGGLSFYCDSVKDFIAKIDHIKKIC